MLYRELTPSIKGLLSIDTSTEQAGIAFDNDQQVLTHSWSASRQQTTTVLPEIDQMLATVDCRAEDISGVVVANGPGTFTGLRVGLAIAKGIVAAKDVPLVGIPTLDIVFAMHPGENIIAVLPAGRGRVVWQRPGEAPVNSSMAELVEAVGDLPLVGELTADQASFLQDSGISFQSEYRDPAVLLRLGAQRIQAGEVDDPITLEPTYLHGVTVNSGPIQDRLKK